MFVINYNNENIRTLSAEINSLNLPGYSGIKKDSRIKDTFAQLIIKCGDLTSEQKSALIKVIDEHPTNEAARKANYRDNHKYKDDRRKAYSSVEDQFDMIYWDQVNGTTTFKDHRTAIKITYSKP